MDREIAEGLVRLADLDPLDTAGSITVVYYRNASVPTYILKNERHGISVDGLNLGYLFQALGVKLECKANS